MLTFFGWLIVVGFIAFIVICLFAFIPDAIEHVIIIKAKLAKYKIQSIKLKKEKAEIEAHKNRNKEF